MAKMAEIFPKISDNPIEYSHRLSQSQSRVFSEALYKVEHQIRLDTFDKHKELAEEICRIIAEVMSLPCDTKARIGGVTLPITLVQEVYALITEDHVWYVIERFEKVNYPIRSPKTYLRTALYNSVFEITAALDSQVRTALFGEKGC